MYTRNPCNFSVQVSMQILQWKNTYTLHVISLRFTDYLCKFCMDISKKLDYYMVSLHLMQGIPVVSLQNQIPCKYYNGNRSVEFQNYRDCGYTCNPHNIYVHITGNILRHRDSPHFLWGKHLQCNLHCFSNPIFDGQSDQSNSYVPFFKKLPLCTEFVALFFH